MLDDEKYIYIGRKIIFLSLGLCPLPVANGLFHQFKTSMVGPSDTTGGEEVLRGEIEVLAGAGIVLGLPVMVVRHDEAATLDDRTALPHGLGPMAALPELDPGPTLRWYSLCRTAGSTGPESAGRPAERREEVI